MTQRQMQEIVRGWISHDDDDIVRLVFDPWGRMPPERARARIASALDHRADMFARIAVATEYDGPIDDMRNAATFLREYKDR